MKSILTSIFLLFSLGLSAQTLIPVDANWKYLDDGSNQGSAWTTNGFNDTTWASGNAELGYGDNDETTVVSYGPDPNNKYITTYFRHSFNVIDTSLIPSLNIDLLVDDGAVVYLNGTELFRQNMPSGSISYTTTASSSANEGVFILHDSLSASALVNGINVIAVEVHQRSNSSSDISFNLFMEVSNTLVPQNSNWKYLDDGSDQGSSWTAQGYNDTAWSNGNAELGYGDGDETTVVGFGPNSNDKYITTYFRHNFNVVNASAILSLDIDLIVDDGAVVYLNGIELFRQNMPSGSINYNTVASSTVSGNSESTYTSHHTLPVSSLVTGNNVLAVEVHQRSNNSSDISFNLYMEAGADPSIPVVTRGPYLQKATTSGMVIKWRTNVPTSSKVNYGGAIGALNQSVYIPGLRTEHSVNISGLDTNAIYYYSFGDSVNVFDGDTSGFQFKTHPLIGILKPVRTWILGDCGTANNNQRNVRDAYYNYVNNNSLYTDNVLLLGDNAYNDGTDTEYQNAIFNIYDVMLKNTVFWSTLGNHDARNTNVYYDIFTFPTAGEAGGTVSGTEEYYSFDYANIHFVCLNSQIVNSPASLAMLSWLTNDLASTTQDWIVAYWHHPPYTNGSHDSDDPSDSGGRLKDMRENALPILEAGGVDLVLSGHSHSYERTYLLNGHYDVSSTFDINTMALDAGSGDPSIDSAYTKTVSGPDAGKGAVYITAGSSGKITGTLQSFPMMYTWQYELGSVVMEVDGNDMRVRFLRDDGMFTDDFIINKPVIQPAPVASFDTTNVNCLGDSTGTIDLTVNLGNPPFTYNWSNGATTEDLSSLIAGTYTVTVTDNQGLSVVSSTVISEPPTRQTIWTGAIDSDWTNEGNWDCGVPDITKDVIIPNGTTTCIIYSGQTGFCNTILVDSGTNLIVQSGAKLEVVH